MKQLIKDIRKDVKELIKQVGGTANISNRDITNLFESYACKEKTKAWTGYKCNVLTTITNQIDYFKYAKGL